MIRYDPALVDLMSNFFALCTNMKVYYIYIYIEGVALPHDISYPRMSQQNLFRNAAQMYRLTAHM